MSEGVVNSKWFNMAVPIVSILLTALAFFIGATPVWVLGLVIIVVAPLILIWVYHIAPLLWKKIKSRVFRKKLTKDQLVRLQVLLDGIGNHMSDSYSGSPFNVWKSFSSKCPANNIFNYSYHGCITRWLADIKENLADSRVNEIELICSLSKAVSESTKLAEIIERQLEEQLRRDELSEIDKTKFRKDWDTAKTHFNHWINEWKSLFKEINKTSNVNCVEYFRTLEMIA